MKKILPLLMLFMCGIQLCRAQSTSGTAENFNQNSSASSTIGGANQNHWYKLVTTGDANITISATASQTNGNSFMYIYLIDSIDLVQLGVNGGYASNGGPSLTVNGLAKGTYYCRINSTDAFSNAYTITNVVALSPTANDAELNDYFIQPLNMNQNDSVKGHIGYRRPGGTFDQNDYYKLILTTDGNVSISYNGDFAGTGSGNGFAYIYLFDKDTTSQLGSSGGYVSNGGASFTVNGLAAGTYYVRITWGGSAAFFTGYTLKNTINSSPIPNDAEPNDYFIQSLNINQSDSVKGHIGYRRNGGGYDQNDYYKLVLNTDASISISYKGDFSNPSGTGGGNGYAYIYLFDKDTLLQLGSNGGFVSNGGAGFAVNGLAAGIYYVRITWGGDPGYFTGYTLKNAITSPPTPNDAEPNDYFNQSLILNGNDSVYGHIGYKRNGGTFDQRDVFKIVSGVDGDITISYTGDLANPSSNGYAYIYLYDKDTTTQIGGNGGFVINGGASFKINGVAAGTYYAIIEWGGNTSYFTGYKLKCRLDTAAFVNDTEPNNTIATASLLNLNPRKSGHIGYRFNGGSFDTDDYWKIVMNATDSMRVVLNLSSNNNTNAFAYISLLDANGMQLFQQSGYVINQSIYNIYFPTLPAGNYYLRILWGGGPSFYCSYNIPVFHVPCDLTPAVINAGGPTTFCAGGSVSLNTTPTFNAYGQSNEFKSYLWNTNAATQNISVNSTGNYSVVAKDVDGCAHASNVIPVTVNPIPATPTITPNGATTFCSGGSVTLTSSAAASYLWSNGATTQSINVTSSGSYSVIVKNAGGCSSLSSAATVVTVNALPSTPTIAANGSVTFCDGGSVTLTASAAASYLWSNGATTPSITVTSSGNYSVVVKNANGCSSASSAATTVTVNSLPSVPAITANGATAFCTGGSVTLTASAATSYLWSNGATTQSINVTTSGNYSVIVRNVNGCSSMSSAITGVTVNSLPIVSLASFNSVCTTDGAFTLSGGSPAGGTYSGTGVSNGQFNPSVAGAGTFTLTYSYTNANNCSATASQSITVNNCGGCTPTISTGGAATTFCEGGSVTLTASAGTSYLWLPGGQTSQSITVSTGGSYSVTVTNTNNCTATSAATLVTVNSLPSTPTVTANSATTFCEGGSVTLTASAATSYLWSNGATTQSINVTSSGNYSVTVKNAAGCSSASSAATVVTVNPLPSTPTIAANGSVSFCEGGSVTLTSSTATSYLWSNGATTQSINATGSGNYSVIVKNAAGCSSASSAATVVTVNPLPQVNLAPFSSVCNTVTSVVLNGGSPAGGTYAGNGVTGNTFNPSLAGVGSTTITYTYTNASGCTASANASINVTQCGSCTASITAGGPVTFCQGGSVTLTANQGSSYVWSNGATTRSITVTSSGSFYVSVTDANECKATSGAVIVSVNPLPSTPAIAVSGPTAFCDGGSVTLTSSVAVSYLWSNGATTQSIVVNTSGNYSVIVKNTAGCSSASSAVTNVTVNNCSGNYCNTNGGSRDKGFILGVYFRNILNISGWSNGGYGNYLNQTASVNKGASFLISVLPGYTNFNTARAMFSKVWIDWNQDGDFNDANELVFSPAGSSVFLRIGNVNVPANALSGKTRMRVMMSSDAIAGNCGSIAFGEVEDYSIQVNGNANRLMEPANAREIYTTVKLYPNPVSNELVVNLAGSEIGNIRAASVLIQITELTGKLIVQKRMNNTAEIIDISRLTPGTYIVKVTAQKFSTTQKIIVQH